MTVSANGGGGGGGGRQSASRVESSPFCTVVVVAVPWEYSR